MSALNQLTDSNGLSTFAPNFSTAIYECILPGATDKTVTVPAGKRSCIISATGSYCVAADTAALMPSNSTFTLTNSIVNLASVWLEGSSPAVQVLHFNSDDAVKISVAFYD